MQFLRRVSLTLVLATVVSAACSPRRPEEYTIERFADAMRKRNLRNIRIEPNRRLSETLKIRAADVYVGNQHMIVIQAAPNTQGQTYAGYFEGYKQLGATVVSRGNLLLVTDPVIDQEIVAAFEDL